MADEYRKDSGCPEGWRQHYCRHLALPESVIDLSADPHDNSATYRDPWSSLFAFIYLSGRKGQTMMLIRREVQNFAIDCEKLMASYLAPDLTTDEKALIVYYVRELAEKFDSGQRNPTVN